MTDLSTATQGLVTLEDGTEFWCPLIEPTADGTYVVRVESGWYAEFTRTGESVCAGVIVERNGSERAVKGRDVVGFEPMTWDEFAGRAGNSGESRK